jgi:hypothetical protein
VTIDPRFRSQIRSAIFIPVSDRDFETPIAITIAIKNRIRINRTPVLIAKQDPGSSGKFDPWIFFLEALFYLFTKKLKSSWPSDQ